MSYSSLPTGKLIRVSFAIAEGRWRLSMNAAKLLFLMIDDFSTFANACSEDEVNSETFAKRTIYLQDITLFDLDHEHSNLYQLIDRATNELMSAFLWIKLKENERFEKVQWFLDMSYNRGRFTYRFNPTLYDHLLRLGSALGKKFYSKVSPIFLSRFYSFLAFRIYLLAQVNEAQHKNCVKISPSDLAELCQMNRSYFPKRPGYPGGTKFGIGNQQKAINEALKNINEDTDMKIVQKEYINKRGKVFDWVFEFTICNGTGTDKTNNTTYYTMIAAGSKGMYPVRLTKNQLETIKLEFPDRWERVLSDVAEWQEIHGVEYKNPLFAARRAAANDGNACLIKIHKEKNYIDPPIVIVDGKMQNVSDDFFKTFFKNKNKRKTDVVEADVTEPDAPISDAPVPDAPVPDAPVPDAPVPDIAGSSNDDDWPFPF